MHPYFFFSTKYVIIQKIAGIIEQLISIPKIYGMEVPGLPYRVWMFSALTQLIRKSKPKITVNTHEIILIGFIMKLF